jgi:hypothetical protein
MLLGQHRPRVFTPEAPQRDSSYAASTTTTTTTTITTTGSHDRRPAHIYTITTRDTHLSSLIPDQHFHLHCAKSTRLQPQPTTLHLPTQAAILTWRERERETTTSIVTPPFRPGNGHHLHPSLTTKPHTNRNDDYPTTTTTTTTQSLARRPSLPPRQPPPLLDFHAQRQLPTDPTRDRERRHPQHHGLVQHRDAKDGDHGAAGV